MIAAPSQRRIPVNGPVKKLQELRYWCHVRAGLRLLARVSGRGVPHLTIEIGGITYSVAYFGKLKAYKVFWPYGECQKQEVRTYAKAHEMGQWLIDRAEKPKAEGAT